MRPAHFNGVLAACAGRRSRLCQRSRAARPGAGRIQSRELRPFRPEPAPLRPFHLADPPLCRSHRSPRADPRARTSATAGSTTCAAASSRRSPSTSPPPSGGRWRPSARRSTGLSRLISPTASAPSSRRASPASPASACSSSLTETGADGFVPAATLGDDYFRYEEGTRRSSARAPADLPARRRGRARLVEAAPFAGALRFEIVSGDAREGSRRKRPRAARSDPPAREESRRSKRR